jgi:hypothetical protein
MSHGCCAAVHLQALQLFFDGKMQYQPATVLRTTNQLPSNLQYLLLLYDQEECVRRRDIHIL